MITILLAILAGICKSIADTKREKLNKSQNKYFLVKLLKLNPNTQFGNIVGYFVTLIITPFSDFWHLLYTIAILCLLCIAPFYQPMFHFIGFESIIWDNFWTIGFLMICYGIGFEITYLTLKQRT